MLYKRNDEKSLDTDLFLNPGKEYRGAPFWAWNGKLNKDLLKRQIECFKEMGFGGYHMHPRYGMRTEYLSEEYLDCILHCIECGKSQDMLSWLYDEDRWPSGFAGGLVTKNPKYRQRVICITKHISNLPEMETDKVKAVVNGLPYMIGCYDVQFDADGLMKSYRKIEVQGEAQYEKYYVYSQTGKEEGMYNNQTYTDIMQPEAVKAFIELTHDRYYSMAGDEYGKSIPAIFMDEPRQRQIEPYQNRKDMGIYYWTYDFDITFQEKYGYDIVEHIPAVIWDTPDNDSIYVRYDYFNHAADLVENAFFKQISEVTSKQGLALTGHLMFENELFGQIRWIGDAMRMYPYFTFPGIDMLRDRVELAAAKQAQSVVRQYGKEAMLSELYGVTGWDFDFKCMKMQGDWQAALGVTIRVPHLSLYSMEGKAKRDYPASYQYQAPWYREYKYVEDHFARLNTVLTRGKPLVSVAVLHPVETAMLHISAGEKSTERLQQMEEDFQSLIRWLLYSTIDFDFINEALLPTQIEQCEGKLKVGYMEYDTVVIPCINTIRSTTIEILARFQESGGKVIFMGKCPLYEDGRKSNAAKRLYDNSIHIMPKKEELLEILEDDRVISIRNSDGLRSESLIYQLREDTDCLWLFIAQARRLGKKSYERSFMYAEPVTVTVRGNYNVMLYDTITGDIKKADYTVSGDKTVINYELYANDSVLLKLTKEPVTWEAMQGLSEKTGELVFLDKVTYERTEENAVVFDMAQYSLDGLQYSEKEYVLEINEMISKQLGIEYSNVQPYMIKDEKQHKVYLRFEFESEMESSELLLALERAEECNVFLNGIQADSDICGFYIDEAIKKVKLPKVKKGMNIVDIEMIVSATKSIEPCYLLGDFDVILTGCMARICTAKNTIGFGAISRQGLPFYGGNLIYETEAETPKCIAKITVSDFGAPCVRVFVDEEDAGLIALAPFQIVKKLSKGRHKFRFVCYGNRNNTVGPVHNNRINDSDYCVTPASWDKKCEFWRHSYFLQEVGILSSPIIEFFEGGKL